MMVVTGKRIILGLLLVGCTACTGSGGGGGAPAVRVDQTNPAPADLQATCEAQAALDRGISVDQISTVSSGRLPDGNFQVNLNAGRDSIACIVNGNAEIVSLK